MWEMMPGSKLKELGKRQGAMIRELLCPNCKSELWELTRVEYHCGVCGSHYFGEEKKGKPCK